MALQENEQRVHYIHHLDYSTRERLVGVFVLLALAFVLGLILVNGRTSQLFEPHVVYYAFLRNAQGITTDSVVKVSGIDVGHVSDIDIANDNKVHLTLYVYKRYRSLIRADSRASLSKMSLFGKASIDIAAGSPSAPILPDGATLTIEEPLSMDELMAELTPVMEKVKQIVEGVSSLVKAINPDDVKITSRELAKTMVSMQAITKQVASGKGTMGRLVFDHNMQTNISRSLANLNTTLNEANKRMAQMKPMIRNAKSLVVDTNRLVRQMNTAMGNVNVELQQLPDLLNRMKVLMDSTNRTLHGMQRIWPLSSAVSHRKQDTLIGAQPADE